MFASFRIFKIIFFCLSIMVFFGCQKSPNYSILQEQPTCNPPCWENITPGITPKSDACPILTANSAMVQPIFDLQDTIPAQFESVLMFSLFDEKQQNGSLFIQDGKVAAMELSLDGDLLLQRAIEMLEEPESVRVYVGDE